MVEIMSPESQNLEEFSSGHTHVSMIGNAQLLYLYWGSCRECVFCLSLLCFYLWWYCCKVKSILLFFLFFSDVCSVGVSFAFCGFARRLSSWVVHHCKEREKREGNLDRNAWITLQQLAWTTTSSTLSPFTLSNSLKG